MWSTKATTHKTLNLRNLKAAVDLAKATVTCEDEVWGPFTHRIQFWIWATLGENGTWRPQRSFIPS